MKSGRPLAAIALLALGGCCLQVGYNEPSTSTGQSPASSGQASSGQASSGQASSGTTSGGRLPVGTAASGGFSQPANYPLNPNPSEPVPQPVILTTFQDRGGLVGLATADYGDGLVWALVGEGDGTFRNGGSTQVAMTVQAICSADFNHDGLADLAISAFERSTNNVGLLTDVGHDVFSFATSTVGTGGTYLLICGDVTGDSSADLVLIDVGSVYVGLGQGDGGFIWSAPINGVGHPRGLAIGNFGGSPGPQIAVADSSASNQVFVLTQRNGVFSPVGPWGVGGGPIGIATADFNGDGCGDLATANNTGDSLSVLLSACNGQVAFGEATTYPLLGGRPQTLATGDFNGDGAQDIAVAIYDPGPQGQNVALLYGNGDGTFQSPTYLVADKGPSSIVAADFNRDGRLDLAVANRDSNDVSVFIFH